MKTLRIFPRKTRATPTDQLAIINRSPNLFDDADKINISVAFTYDIPIAEKLYNEWKYVGPVEIGGPALNSIGVDFEPGIYLKEGYTITSRGCTNKCWFCSVWKREPFVKELPLIQVGLFRMIIYWHVPINIFNQYSKCLKLKVNRLYSVGVLKQNY